ncbi:MAG: hypothetical protein IPM97_06890 [Bdellovibrionaceae bacterium]|nr:hypothetical protein [Pseudobdellovibrionaceae bacterium]
MKLFFTAITFVSLNQAFADSKNCDLLSEVPATYDSIESSHGVTLNGKTILVGGKGEKSPRDLDRLAVQRGLIRCGQPMLKCFAGSEALIPTEFVVTFTLNPVGNAATASNFKMTWKKPTTETIEKCLVQIWTEIQYGLIIKDKVRISMPIKIK